MRESKYISSQTVTQAKNPNLTLIRAVAVFFVVTVHSLLHSKYYVVETVGKLMLLMNILRVVSGCCVPLFLLLTGYLCSHKKLSKTYWRGVLPKLLVYLFFCCLILFYQRTTGQVRHSFESGLLSILSMEIGYGWYMEMYVGLFFLIPFLNVLWSGLENQNQKKTLLAVMLLLTTAPSLVNRFDWMTPGFWRNPASANMAYQIIPDWWTGIFPITYYFIGNYIREYGCRLKKTSLLAVFAVSVVAFGCYNYYLSYGVPYIAISVKTHLEWGSFEMVICSVLLFLLLLKLDMTRLPQIWQGALNKISQLSLGLYLCSYITDDFLHTRIQPFGSTLPAFFLLGFLTVPLSFFAAAGLSQLVNWITEFAMRPFRNNH